MGSSAGPFDAPLEIVRRLTIVFCFYILIGDITMDGWSTGPISGGDVRFLRSSEPGSSPGRSGVHGMHGNEAACTPTSPPLLGLGRASSFHLRSKHYYLQRADATSRATTYVGLPSRRTYRVRASPFFRLHLALCLRLRVSVKPAPVGDSQSVPLVGAPLSASINENESAP